MTSASPHPDAPDPAAPGAAARVWLAQLEALPEGGSTAVLPLPRTLALDAVPAALAELAALCLSRDRTLQLVVAGDALLPELANAIDPALRPLCLVLPAAPFAARVVVRATLSLLKSRLARGGDDGDATLWSAQQRRVDADPALWQRCLAWAAAGEGEWPEELPVLFPVVIAGTSAAAPTSRPPDFAVALAPAAANRAAPRQLLLQGIGGARAAALAKFDEDELLRAELAVLAQEVAHMELELATVQAEVGEFARRYYASVGALMSELDGLQAKLALRRAVRAPRDQGAARAARAASDRARRSREEQARYEQAATPAEQPFRPSTDIKRLYRQVAQKIHPDRAAHEAERSWRTQLMSEANRAYRAGDEATLLDILARWQQGQPTADASLAPAPGAQSDRGDRLADQIERMKRRLGEIEAELRRLFASKLYELFIAARLAGRQGRDLLAEMVADLETRIAAARAALAEPTR